MSKNIEMNIKTNDSYEVLYPNVKANSVIDFSGDNPLLKNETAALFKGLPENPVSDDVFQILSKAALITDSGAVEKPDGSIQKQVRVEVGTYVGDGTKTRIILFNSKPYIVLVNGRGRDGATTTMPMVYGSLLTGAYTGFNFSIAWGNTYVTISGSDEARCANISGQTYYYGCIGIGE